MDDFRRSELGAFLRARREQLPPAEPPGGAPSSRRRTPGTRRSEVAARAKISVEWYTRLEQGRGGHPSTQVLDAICDALQLQPEEREHAFLLAYGSSGVLYEDLSAPAQVHLQRLVDQLGPWPAYIKSPSWDVLVWNTPAARVLTDYAALAPAERNVLRILFLHSDSRRRIKDWEGEAKRTVATFRTELVRWGDRSARASTLIRELTEASPEFRTIWKLNEVGHLGEGEKTLLLHDGTFATMRYESLSLDAYRGLGLVTYTPADNHDPPPTSRHVTLEPSTADEIGNGR
ncbi:helix-turn-helix transcriptional regulator [Streptomyces sp. NL15-2K]|nr:MULTISPECIES: helix-turn-helix transcriptional regulator [Actinomycetes]WKX07244.1 helix-turn-helix transcriptional regulator [Kutzneria buriramensis]